MNTVGDFNLWAIGYEDPARASAVRAELLRVESMYGLHVLDGIVVTRHSDGSFKLDRDEPLSVAAGTLGFGFLGFLVGLVVLQPLAGAAVAVAVGGLTAAAVKGIGVNEEFVNEVKELVKPGTSALFLLTRTDDPEAVAHAIAGLGGTILKTNVSPELTRTVQDCLSSRPPHGV